MQPMHFMSSVYQVKNSFVKHKGLNVLIWQDPTTQKHKFFLGSWEMNQGCWIGNREIKKEEAKSIFKSKVLGSSDRVFFD